MKASIVIGSYNEGEYLGWTITHVARALPPDCEIIVVDDCSTDGSGEMALEAVERLGPDAPDVCITRPGARLGVAAGRNRGVEHASGDYVVFLDAHSAPMSGDWLTRLLQPLEDDENVAIAAPAYLSIPEMTWADHVAGVIPNPPSPEAYWKMLRDGANVSYGRGCRMQVENDVLCSKWMPPLASTRPHRIQIAKGGCMAMRTEDFRSWGGFDTGLTWPWGWDDDEMSLRAWRLGYSVVSVPRAHVGIVYRSENSYGGAGMSNRGHLRSSLRTAIRLFSWRRVEHLIQSAAHWSTLPSIMTELMRSDVMDERAAIEAASPIDSLDHIWDEFGDWME